MEQVAGRITVGQTTYDVILRPRGGAAGSPPSGNGPRNNIGGGKRSRKQKQEGGKTRKLSPYMKFAQEARKKVVAEHPEWKSDIVKVGKEIGQMWRGLSDAEKAKY